MTMGQRIAEERKKLGISQEALGEKMGVSRQAISKWEADGAVPEIDKLIALSKLFGVSVGWLLGVEKEPEPPQGNEDFSEKQLQMIEEIVKQYQAPKEPEKRSHKILKGILVGGLAALVLFTCLRTLGRMENLTTMENQLSSLHGMTYGLDSRIAALEAGGQTVQAAPALLARYSFEVEQLADQAEPKVRFVAMPNSWQEGDQGYLDIRGEDGTVTRQLCDWSGSFLSAECVLALQDNYKLCFTIVHTDGSQDQQILYDESVEDLKSALTITASAKPGTVSYRENTLTLKAMLIEISMPILGLEYGVQAWDHVDLVLLGDGDKEEIGRFNLLLAQGPDDDAIYSPSIGMRYESISFEGLQLAKGDVIDLYIDAEMSNGMSIMQYVTTWQLGQDGKMT